MSASPCRGGHPHPRSAVPRGVLIGALVMVLTTIGLIVAARTSDRGLVRASVESPAQVVRLRFSDRADGAVEAVNVDTGHVVKVFPPGEKGFVRGVLRGMARQRRLASVGRAPPVTLSRWPDGRVALEDPETGFAVDLRAFGRSNSAEFVALFAEESR